MRSVDREKFSQHLTNISVRLSVKRGQTLEYWAGDTLVGIKVNGMFLINTDWTPRKRHADDCDYLP
jgi:hypothetical protein